MREQYSWNQIIINTAISHKKKRAAGKFFLNLSLKAKYLNPRALKGYPRAIINDQGYPRAPRAKKKSQGYPRAPGLSQG